MFFLFLTFLLSSILSITSPVFSLSLSRNGSGAFISDLVRGGAAEADGRLMQGDQILAVEGEDMRQASQETIAAILKVNVKHHF